MNNVYRVLIANCPGTAQLSAVAETAELTGLSVFRGGHGWTVRWGIEDTTAIEFVAAPDEHSARIFVGCLLKTARQECAYVTINGAHAELWGADGSTVEL